MTREVVLGIDFGTSYTSAGALVGDRVELVQDNGDAVLPSVVYVPDRGAIEVGRRAAMRQLTDPAGVVRSVKRVLGLPPASELMRRYAAGAAFKVDTSGERVMFKLRSGEYAPEQIAAWVLGRIRELAEQRFGGMIRKAVLTMSAAPPAGYREAVTRAARIAHLDVLEIISEPIAGAIALGVHGQQAERRLVVCDFGGGTFDVSAVTQSGLRFSPIATYGDPYLGGDDFDEAIAEGIAGVVHRNSGYDMHRDTVRWSELLFRCENAKRQLSSRMDSPFLMREAYLQAGATRDLELVLDRRWVEGRWQGLIDRAGAVITELMRRAGWRYEDVDHVVMIGGSSLVPMFRRLVGGMFSPAKLLTSLQADVAVAIGATLLTSRYGLDRRDVPVLDLAS
jgi:molecular chaperone DnaK